MYLADKGIGISYGVSYLVIKTNTFIHTHAYINM